VGWKPITTEALERLIAEQLATVSPEVAARYARILVPLRSVPIRRAGKVDQVFVIAEYEGTVLYYEDVEEGFNLSELDAQGFIASPGYEQWELGHALERLLN